MSILMIGICMQPSYVPARRASNVDAIESLRND
jgi:ABC-type lipoprotein release transport system permease subunit